MTDLSHISLSQAHIMEQGQNLVGQFYRNHFITSIQCHAQVGAFVQRNAEKSFKTKHLTKAAQTSFEAALMACSLAAYHTMSTLSLCYPTQGSFYFIYTLLITQS